MKTFVRCTVVILFMIGLSSQVNAQSDETKTDQRFKVLTQEQVNSLTADQIAYLLKNDIAVKVQDGSDVLYAEDLRQIQGKRPSSKPAMGSSVERSSMNHSSGNEELSVEEVRQMEREAALQNREMKQQADAQMSEYRGKSRSEQQQLEAQPAQNVANQAAQEKPVRQTQKIKVTQEEINNFSADQQVDFQQNPGRYEIVDSKK